MLLSNAVIFLKNYMTVYLLLYNGLQGENMNSPLVFTDWLNANFECAGLFIIDVSMSKVIGKEPIVYNQLNTIPNSYKVSIENDL
jgi:hypothetical protein